MKIFYLLALLPALAACTTPEERIAACEAQGSSKDTCIRSENLRRALANDAIDRQTEQNSKRAKNAIK